MPRTYVENTTKSPITRGGRLLMPGEGVWVETPDSTTAISGTAVLQDPTNGSFLGVGGRPFRPRRGASVILLGDSWQNRCSGYGTMSALVRSNNVALATVVGHGMGTGQVIDANNSVQASFNVRDVGITRIDADHFSFPSVGQDDVAVPIANRQLLYTVPHMLKDDGYYFWLNALLGGALRMVRNAGVASNTSADVLDRLDRDVLAYVCDLVLWQPCLYNDLVNAGFTADQIIALLDQTLLKLVNANREVLIFGPLAFTANMTTARHQALLKVVKWMKHQARKYAGVYFADTMAYQVDTAAGTLGAAKAGMLMNDGFHNAPLGAIAQAQAGYDAIGHLIPRANFLVTSPGDNYATDPTNTNILDSVGWAAAGGTRNAATGAGVASGAVGAGLTATSVLSAGATAAWSMVAAADGVGYDCQCVFTPAAANDYICVSLQNPAPAARFSGGKRLKPTVRVGVSNVAGSGLRTINGVLSFAGAAPSQANFLAGSASDQAHWLQTDRVLPINAHEIVIPTDGVSSCDMLIYFVAGAAGTPVTCKVGRMGLEISAPS